MTHWPEESPENEPTSVETIVFSSVFMGGSGGKLEETRGDTDREDEGDGRGFAGEGARGMGIGEEAPLEPDGDKRGVEDECEKSLATVLSVA